jgi:RHS repeat-associated protein
LAALAGSIQGVTGGKFGLQQVQSSGVLGPGISDLLQRQTDQYVGSNRPKAFLNWILLDEQFKIVNSSSGFEQVGPDDQLKIFLKTGLPISQNGYLYVYTSNESPVDVFFDNLQVSHVRGPLLEETHYYPFGLAMSGISSKAAGKLENMMKFNGGNELQSKEFSNGGGLELYDANFRTYDPQIGRFHQQDPLADVLEDESPYSFASNNPILYNDPLGLAKTDDNTLPEVVVTVVRRKKATPPPQAPQTIPAGATPLPLTPSPLTPVPPQAPVVPINTPPSTNPIPVIVETGAGLLSRFLGVIGGLLIPTPTGAGADKVPHPFAPDPFPGHGNRRDNSNPHIVYKFTFAPKDGKTPVLKYGISDVYRNGFNRPEGQLAAFKAIYGQTVTMQVLTRTVNRAAALFIEAGLVGKHVSQWGVMPREQKRPGGF